MHHKFVTRDSASVWTGSLNWTDDAWSRQENVIAVVHSPAIAKAYDLDFEQLWTTGDVARSGFVDPRWARTTASGRGSHRATARI